MSAAAAPRAKFQPTANYLTPERLQAVITYAELGIEKGANEELIQLAEEGIAILTKIAGPGPENGDTP